MKNLKLYTASAGSGKTYQLALNYIAELFRDPGGYRHILAVTFTNKAAGEMKHRILEKLFQLSTRDFRASGYAEYLLENGLVGSGEEIQQTAGYLLKKILHDYTAFYVQTIDKFFQWVIRGFTREIGLQNGYTLELDTSSVLTEAVDMLIFKMDEDVLLRSWLIKFAEEKINEGKSWDFFSDVFTLGKEVFKESYQAIQTEAENPEERKEKFELLRKKLNSKISSFENSLKSRAKEAMSMIENSDISLAHMKYGESGVAGLFLKPEKYLPGDLKISARNREGVDNVELWFKKKDPSEQFIRELFDRGLNRLLTEILNIWDTGKEDYFTALVLKDNLYSFGILNDIADQMLEITREKNLFLISDASMFLKRITAENEAPFVFEKAGNYFSHYMLDEFQDTSRFQWDNFFPLIENGLATGRNSIIVGDVKQSIYRWRNSDWKILATELNQKISEQRIEEKSLDTNYRSARELVAYNNSIFLAAPEVVKENLRSSISVELPEFEGYWMELIDRVYGNARQKEFQSADDKNAYISHDFLFPENKKESLEYIKEWLPRLIKDLQDRNFTAGDITILVRSGSEGRDIASILMGQAASQKGKYNFNVISNDSLYLANNSAVRFLLSLLKFFSKSGDILNISYIKHEYLSCLSKEPERTTDWHSIFKTDSPNPLRINDEVFAEFEDEMSSLRKLPLYDLTERLIHIFRLNKNIDELAYIQAFQDVILDYTRKETSDITSFLRYWENVSSKATLSVSETQDALRIMTIHKAKGLEFKVVIIPFCSWSFEPENRGGRRTLLWPSTHNTPYNEFSHIPVAYSGKMKESLFKQEYFEEMFRTWIDNLNLLYVAFTRAEYELHACSFLSNDKGNLNNVGDLLLKIFQTSDKSAQEAGFPWLDLQKDFDEENLSFRRGNPSVYQPSDQEKSNVITRELIDYPVTTVTPRLALNHKNIYLSDLKEDEKGFTGYGTQMHEIFADIRSKNDVEQALRNAWLKGLISGSERKQLQEEISTNLNNSPQEDWFSGKWVCKLEQELISEEGEILRPDRVMLSGSDAVVVDYKFGKEKKSAYSEQMNKYCQALAKTGLKNIKSYIWYYNLKETVEIENDGE